VIGSLVTLIGLTLWWALSLAGTGVTQATPVLREINPDASTLHSTDPNGATGGRIQNLAYAGGQTYFGASEWGGLFRTLDAGRHWQRVDSFLPTATWDVEVSPTDPKLIVVTSLYDGALPAASAISVSRDGGATWTRPPSAIPPASCPQQRAEPSAFGVTFDPADPSRIYAGTNCGLAKSADGGTNWSFVQPQPPSSGTVWDVAAHHGVIDVCGEDHHNRSFNGGTTWQTATGMPLTSARCVLAPSPDERDVIFALAGSNIFQSVNGGKSWNSVHNPNPTDRTRKPFLVTNKRGAGTFDLWFGQAELWRLTCTSKAAAGKPRCESTTSWVGGFTRDAKAHDDAADLVFDRAGGADACPTLLASDGGVYFNTVTSSPACHTPVWDQPKLSPHALWVFSLAAVDMPNGSRFLYFGTQDNGAFASDDGGATWTNRKCCDGLDVAAGSDVLFSICCAGDNSHLYVERHGTGQGSLLAPPHMPPGSLTSFAAPDGIDYISASSYVAATTAGVFTTPSILSNVTWTMVPGHQSVTAETPCAVQAAGDPQDPYLLVKSGECTGRSASGLWLLDPKQKMNAARGWRKLIPPTGAIGFGVFSISRSEPNRIAAAAIGSSDARVVFSSDGGATWIQDQNLNAHMVGQGKFRALVRNGPIDFTGFGSFPQASLLAFDPADANRIVAGSTHAGLFLSHDGGNSWIVVTDSSGNGGQPVLPRPVAAAFVKGAIYIGTQGRGIWRVNY
jgi:photosystem II stability/assembly factor-like uncharacterized protein